MTGLLDGVLDVVDVEALFRGQLHELRVLGFAKLSVLVVGDVVVVHEVRSSVLRRPLRRADRVVDGPPGADHCFKSYLGVSEKSCAVSVVFGACSRCAGWRLS
ncbi:hypothetical protein OIM90_26245 [Streptomyces sp. AD16]|nr:hypothetical protein OIM90_26245 [Streptomyces sp. AD16]